MTGPASQDAPATRFAIDIVSDTDRRLVQLMFHEKVGLANTFKHTLGIEQHWHTGNKVILTCDEATAANAKSAFAELSASFGKDPQINKQTIKAINAKFNPAPAGLTGDFQAANQNAPSKKRGPGGGSVFTPKNEAQAELAKLITENDLTFAVGPAGTGKTHVAVALAIAAYKAGKVKKIMLTRPAQESGERLGFLPGNQNDKMSPYMRPIYDELDKAFGPGKYVSMIADGTIEIAPLGFMRGRTFTDAFVIVDEAQNCSREQTKMYLTRIGENSKMVVTGDPNQIDLQNKDDSGLMWAAGKLKGKPGVGVQEFDPKDVMRSKIVATIIASLDETSSATLEAEAAKPEITKQKQGPGNSRW